MEIAPAPRYCRHSAAMFGWERSRAPRVDATRPHKRILFAKPQGNNALHRPGALFLALLALLVGFSGFAAAQALDAPRQRLDAVRAALIELDASFKNASLSDGDLQRLRADIDPLAGEVQSVIGEL